MKPDSDKAFNQIVCRLFTEAWIETFPTLTPSSVAGVASSRRRGLKPERAMLGMQPIYVASSRRRGLKPETCPLCGGKLWSPLHGGVD